MNAMLVKAALDLAAIGIERWAISGRVEELEAAGKNALEIADELRRWRDQEIAVAQAKIDRAP